MQLEKNLGGERRSEMNTVEDRTQRLGLTAPFDSAIIFVQLLHPTLRLIRTCTPLNDFFAALCQEASIRLIVYVRYITKCA